MLRKLTLGLGCSLSLFASSANAEVMLGAFVPGNGWDQQNIVSLNEQLTKQLSFVNLFSAFSEDWDQLYWQASAAADLGMTPMISWMPVDQSRPEENILPEIELGLWDQYIDEWSQRFLAWRDTYQEGAKPTLLMRFGHEFNGNWYSYGDSPDWYVAVYQHIHDRFEVQGVNEYIEWVWSVNNISVDSYNDITRYYPGDDYVDWTSIDGYNWGSNYSWTNWENFTAVYADSYNTLVSNYPEKPILIAEVGSAEPLDNPDPAWGQNGDDSDMNEDKDLWNRDMTLALENTFPAIRALCFFNVNKELSWSLIEQNNTGLNGLNSGVASGYFVSEFISATAGAVLVDPPLQPGKRDTNPRKNKKQRVQLSSRRVDRSEQIALAQSRELPSVNRARVQLMRNGFLNMSDVAKSKLREMKLSVLDAE